MSQHDNEPVETAYFGSLDTEAYDHLGDDGGGL